MEEPLAVIEGAKCPMVRMMPAFMSLEVFWGGVGAEGDIFGLLR